MISYMLQVMNTVRVNLLEGFILPELNISYWDYVISLLIIGLLIKVLVNSVKNDNSNGKGNVGKNDKSNGKGSKLNTYDMTQDEIDNVYNNRGD